MSRRIRSAIAVFALVITLGVGYLFARSADEIAVPKGNASVTTQAVISLNLAAEKAEEDAAPAAQPQAAPEPVQEKPEPKPKPEPEPKPKPKPEPKPEPKPKPKPKPEPKPEPDPKPKPEPEPKPEPKPKPEKKVTQSASQTTTTATAPTQTSPQPAKTGAKQQVSQVELTAGRSDSEDSYLSKLNRHLAQKYEYPRRAKRRNQEGTPVVRFEFDRQGKLISLSLAEGSRYRLLDEAALEIIRNSEPLPTVPDNMEGESFSFTLPIRYELRD